MRLARQQHASEADTLQIIDKAISQNPQDNNDGQLWGSGTQQA